MTKTDKISFDDLFLESPLEIEVKEDSNEVNLIVKQKNLTDSYKKQKNRLLLSIVNLFLYKEFINSVSKDFFSIVKNDILDTSSLSDEDMFHLYAVSLSKFIKQKQREREEKIKENDVVDYKKIIDNKQILSEILSSELDVEGELFSFDRLKQKYKEFFSMKKEYVIYNSFEDAAYLIEFINTYKKYKDKVRLIVLGSEYYSKEVNLLYKENYNFMTFLQETNPVNEKIDVEGYISAHNSIRVMGTSDEITISTREKNIIDRIVDFLKSISINISEEIKYEIGILFLSIIKSLISSKEVIIVPVPILKYFSTIKRGTSGSDVEVEIETYTSYVYDEYGFIGKKNAVYEFQSKAKYLNSFIFIDIEQSGIQTSGEKDVDNIKQRNLYIERIELDNLYKYNFYYTIKANSLSDLYTEKNIEDRYKDSINEVVIGGFGSSDSTKRKVDNI